MKEILNSASCLIYILVGFVCLLMAYKSIFSEKYLPFHEEAAARKWDTIDKPLQNVIITVLRISGLGFLIVSLVLTIFPVINYFRPDPVIKFSVPVISIIYCFGLFLFNFRLFRQTKANTPWKGSLIAMFLILSASILSLI